MSAGDDPTPTDPRPADSSPTDPSARDRVAAVASVAGVVAGAGLAALVGGGVFAVALGPVADSPAAFAATYVGAYAMVGCTAAAYVLFRGGRAFLDLALPTAADLRDVLAAYLGVAVATAVIAGLAAVAGLPVFDPRGLGDPVAAPVLLTAAPLAVAVGVPARVLLFRNVCQKRLAAVVPAWAAVGVASLSLIAFTLAPFAGAAPTALVVPALALAVASNAVGLVYERSGTLVAAWLLHAALTASLIAVLYLDATGALDLSAAL